MIVGLTLDIMHLAVKLCYNGKKKKKVKIQLVYDWNKQPQSAAQQTEFPSDVGTFQRVEGVTAQAQGAITDDAAETLPVEEVALGAQPLHHINPLGAEVAGVAAPEARSKVFTAQTLKDGGGRGGACRSAEFRQVTGFSR